MARFNGKVPVKKVEKTINRAHGEAFVASDRYRLVSMALTSFMTDQFYRSADEQMEELWTLIDRVDPQFAAKTAVFARREFGMRSVTHVMAAILSMRASGKSWAKSFYDQIVVRPDDMLEIFSAYQSIGGGKMTNAMKKGFARAFDRFDGYQLAKYRGENRVVKLVDIANLVHPTPTDKNSEALKALMAGTLRNTDTWEARMSALGREELGADAYRKGKYAVWSKLLKENRLGYFALLRNVKNICTDAPGLANRVYDQLIDPDRISGSRVLPFRMLSAYMELKRSRVGNRRVLKGLRKAINIACRNMPAMRNSLVVVDNSGSMSQPVAGSRHVLCNEVGALFGIALAKRSKARIMEFATTARYLDYNQNTNALDFAASFAKNNQVGHGTDFKAIFDAIGRHAYSRIFIFSDVQAWVGYQNPERAFRRYRNRSGADPFVYTFDLTGYGTLQFQGPKTRTLAGFHSSIFDVLLALEEDSDALYRRIDNIDLS